MGVSGAPRRHLIAVPDVNTRSMIRSATCAARVGWPVKQSTDIELWSRTKSVEHVVDTAKDK